MGIMMMAIFNFFREKKRSTIIVEPGIEIFDEVSRVDGSIGWR